MTQPVGIQKAAEVLFEPGQVVEVRAIVDGGSPWNGYFDNHEELARKIEALEGDPKFTAVYWSLNRINPDLIARRANQIGRSVAGAGEADIIGRRWLLVDVDPERPSGISSTADEKAAAFVRADTIAAWLDKKGWPEPVQGDSGNGAHLLYRVDLPNNPDTNILIRQCLKVLSAKFSDVAVKVDISVGDAPRIIRVYGTLNRKGTNRADRPHRRAALRIVPDDLTPVPTGMLRELANEAEELAAATTTTGTVTSAPGTEQTGAKAGDGLDLRAWLTQHADNLPFTVHEKVKAGNLFFAEIAPCPFSQDHDSGAYIGQLENGGIYARCQHDRCGGTAGLNRWAEIRALIEPKKSKLEKGDMGKKANKEPPKKTLPFFEMTGQLYLDVADDMGRHWFAHLDDAGRLVFSATVKDTDGIEIVPRMLDRHPDTGEVVPIVGLPNRTAMEDASALDPIMLYQGIDRHLSQYIDAPALDRQLFIYYILYSWLYLKCKTAPYLRFLADTGKGKSRFLRVISDLCFYPIAAGGASTHSGIMRYHEKWRGTLRIDEADLQGGADNPLIKYLNLGFEAGQYYILTNKNDPTKQEYFDAFGPKVIAMREPFGDVATEGRVLSFVPRETTRRDIPVELGVAYADTVKGLRAHIAVFILHHWSTVDGMKMLEFGDIAVEPRLRQMLRPLSLILQLFPDGESRLTEYLKSRQIEIKRERAASFDGLCFNLALKLADGAEDLQDDPKFQKYYKTGSLQAVEPRMIAALLGTKTPTVSRALRRIGFATTDTKIDFKDMVPDGKNEKDERNFKVVDRKKTVIKISVPDERAWIELVTRYHFVEPPEPGSGQLAIITDANPECPKILKGNRYVAVKTCTQSSGNGGTSGIRSTEGERAGTSTASTVGTVLQGTRLPPSTAGEYIFIQSNPNHCAKCGFALSHFMASTSGQVSDPTNVFICKACHDQLPTMLDAMNGDEVQA